jgi:hypothetical protein
MKRATSILLALSLFVLSAYHVEVASTQGTDETLGSAVAFQSLSPRRNVLPVIYHPDAIDKDFDRIVDTLEDKLVRSNATQALPVIVTLYKPVENQDLEFFEMFGGNITYIYRNITYGFAGLISAGKLSDFAQAEGANLVVIEPDLPAEYHLDVSVPLIRARPIVWQDYGYNGSSNHSIAIIDTGIDDSHLDLGPYGNLDFAKKIVGWYDASGDDAATPEDYGEHGSHVAGITAGTGNAETLQGNGSITTTFTWFFPPVGYGYFDFLDVKIPGVINLSLGWDGPNNALLRLYDPVGSIVDEVGGKSKPLTLTYNTETSSYPTGLYRVLVGNIAGTDNPFSLIETYPYQGLNDGFNLLTGVAPNSKLVSVKVFDNRGSGTSSTIMAGLDWIIANRLSYKIIVASMSLGIQEGGVDSTLDQKVDTLVKSGIVTVVSAGNDYPEFSIGSPGTAAYAITIAATNDLNGITEYSSNGNVAKNEFGLIKPDVAAPGGSFQSTFGSLILSADSNDVDAEYSRYADQALNDYQQLGGTSMAAPHVSGTAALIVQALGHWNWTEAEALEVKMLISMTAFEVQSGEPSNIPPLNRGDKDNREGYGRISVDAAIEASTMTYLITTSANGTFGSDPGDKKVWARQVTLSTSNSYEFDLTVPIGADYDLYLYRGIPDTYGQPVIAGSSIDPAQGADESISYAPNASGTYYIVAKWVSGNGQFILQSAVEIPGDVNRDAIVNAADLLLLNQAYGTTPSSANWNPKCDFNKDNMTNVSDLRTLGKNYGRSA